MVGIFINQVAVIYAVQKAGAANVGMLMASAPIIAALLARKLGHERIGARHVVGIAVAATGALLVLYGGGGVGGAPLIGWLLGLVTAATWATYSVLLRPLMARYSAERLSAAVLLTGSAMLIPVSLPQLATQDWGAPSGNAWLALGYSLVFSLLVTNVLWFDAHPPRRRVARDGVPLPRAVLRRADRDGGARRARLGGRVGRRRRHPRRRPGRRAAATRAR